MQNQQTPQVLAQPFCAQGDKNTIPNAATGSNLASLQEGFPAITELPASQGGIPPERQDFNGAMNLNSQFYFAFQNGWWPTFTQEVSDAIGGYPQGAVLWLFDTENKVYTPLLSLAGNNTYNFNTNPEYIGQYWARILPDSGRGLPLGAVYFSSSSNADDNPGALPLWTGEYYSNGSSLYPDFYSWVKSHTELCKTKQQYDDAINTYGECPFYVIDEVSGSLRLPKLANYLKIAGTTGITQGKAGLPNITGYLYRVRVGDFAAFGALSESYQVGATSQTMENVINQQDIEIRFNASDSNGIYGASDTVTPAHTTLYPWIYAFNSAVSASVAQAAEFTGALSGKVSISGGTMTGPLKVPTPASATNDNTVPNTEWIRNLFPSLPDYTAPVSQAFGTKYRSTGGWLYVSANNGSYGSGQCELYDENDSLLYTFNFHMYNDPSVLFIPVPAGYYYWPKDGRGGAGYGGTVTFFPFKK